MKLQIRSWFKKPGKTAAPMTAAALAGSVAEAERDLDAALKLVDAFRGKLAAQRTEESLQEVRDAKASADDVQEMLTLLRGELAAAIEREAAEAHAELERQCADLGAQLTVDAIHEAIESDVQAEAAEILALAVRRKKRLDQLARFRVLHSQHEGLLFKLGQISAVGSSGNTIHASSPEPVIAHLTSLVRTSPHDGQTLRALIEPLLPTHAIYPRPLQLVASRG